MAYLDYAATAPTDPAAAAAVAEALAHWANPSSVHAPGRAVRAALEDARATIAEALGWRGELILTSGGTEALGLALAATRPPAIAASATEHQAVLGRLPEGELRLPVTPEGTLCLVGLAERLAALPAGSLVAVMHANNETGVIQPLAEVAALVRAAGHLLLADCVQSAGKLALPDADLIALSAHKLGGPPGVGALLVSDLARLDPEPAGGQERGYRSGTENTPGAIGFAAAASARSADADAMARAALFQARLEARLAAAGAVIVGAGAPRLPTISCVRLPGVEALTQLIALDLEGYAVSAGAACSSGRVAASHVLTAMGLSRAEAGEAIRISTGWATTMAEIEAFADCYTALAERWRARRAA